LSELLQQKSAARAQISSAESHAPSCAPSCALEPGREDGDAEALDLVELFFFAYRDFVGDADRLLENYGFGRAHHRILHFVHRLPGLAIAELLDILKITKQSLNRVLKQLLDAGFVEARADAQDRRRRLLYVTPSGAELARELAALQSARLRRVLADLPPAARGAAATFLFAMVDGNERERVRRLLGRAEFGQTNPGDDA
jgi:DNA-binding MarR family transcriptional regulator